MDNLEDYQYDINVVKVVEFWCCGSVVGSWLFDFIVDVLCSDREFSKFDGGVLDSGEGCWIVYVVVDFGVFVFVISSVLWLCFELCCFGVFVVKVLNGMCVMFGGYDVR